MEQKNELQTTVTYCVVAALFASVALFSSTSSAPSLDLTQFQVGEYYYPDLNKDIDQVQGLEVYAPDSDLGIINNFKVQKKGDIWVIPSQKDYPADAVKKLGEVAAALFDIKRDKFLTSQSSVFKQFDVLDPTDEVGAGELDGLGIKVNLLDATGNPIASFIFGKPIEGKNGFRYMRRSDEKRVYESAVANVELSTKFSDWIETDLLTVKESDLKSVKVNDYEVDLRRGALSDINTLILEKSGQDWLYTGVTDKEETKKDATSKIVSGLDNMIITGVEKKPEELQKYFRGEIKQVNRAIASELQPRGFYFIQDGNAIRMVSEVGGVEVTTNDGVHYQLWFGQLELTAEGSEKDLLNKDKKKDAKEAADPGKKKDSNGNRYLVITVDLDESFHVKPTEPKTEGLKEEEVKKLKAQYETDLSTWKSKRKSALEKVEKLNGRFSEWYYKISNDDYQEIRVKREDLVQPKADNKPTNLEDNPFDKDQ